MKTLTLFLSLLFSFPFVLSAQMVGETLQKVSVALDNRQWDQAVTLFRQAVNTNVEKAEMFYWTSVDKSLEVSSRIGRELAAYYKKSRSYDKAYLFYKELLQKSPNDWYKIGTKLIFLFLCNSLSYLHRLAHINHSLNGNWITFDFLIIPVSYIFCPQSIFSFL
mgnify:CR=1 FL=1